MLNRLKPVALAVLAATLLLPIARVSAQDAGHQGAFTTSCSSTARLPMDRAGLK